MARPSFGVFSIFTGSSSSPPTAFVVPFANLEGQADGQSVLSLRRSVC